MERHGVDSVRIGPYIQVQLPHEHITSIRHQMSSAQDACFGCGSADHLVAACPSGKTKRVAASPRVREPASEPSPVDRRKKAKSQPRQVSPETRFCVRCGNTSHSAERCFAKRDIEGRSIGDAVCCLRCGRDSHEKNRCFARADAWGNRLWGNDFLCRDSRNVTRRINIIASEKEWKAAAHAPSTTAFSLLLL